MNNRIAILGANEPLLPFYKQAQKLGYKIVGIATEDGAVCKKYCEAFYPVSFNEVDRVIEICKKEEVEGILSFSLESALPAVTHVAKELELVSNSLECLELTCNKFNQRQALENAGIPVPKYYLIELAEDLKNVTCGYPVIVKPIDSGGSQGICKVNSFDELITSYQYAKQFSRSGKVIVEQYVDGGEFSVEYISHNGKHYFLQITDKVTSGPPRFVEMQHHQPADIPTSIANRIRDIVEASLTALKIENSASHTEIKLNQNNELFIIETGARMGGDYISSDLVRLSTGYDFVKGAIDLALGSFKQPDKNKNLYSGVYFYSKLAPEIGNIIKHSEYYPEIVESEYSDEPLMEVISNADRRGYLIYQSSNGKLTF